MFRVFFFVLVLCTLLVSETSHAGSWAYCGRPAKVSAGKIDRMLSFASAVEEVLKTSEAKAVIVSRSGFDLSRFNIRYSHAGIGLKDEAQGAWFVRQLYFDCNEERPRIYDQGIGGFVLGHDEDLPTFVSLVFLHGDEEDALEQKAADNRLALALLATHYSANAYPFSTLYQNCNQWVIELIAHAFGQLEELPTPSEPRQQAQAWLKQVGYQPTDIAVRNAFLGFIGRFLPYVHRDDHPAEELAESVFRVSMPASIESFLKDAFPQASRVEMCLKGSTIVIHRGWEAIDDVCAPTSSDRVLELAR